MPFSQADQVGILTAIARKDSGLAADIIDGARNVPRPYKIRVLSALLSADTDQAELVQLVKAEDTSTRHRGEQNGSGMPPTEPMFDVAAGVDPDAIPPNRIGEPAAVPLRPEHGDPDPNTPEGRAALGDPLPETPRRRPPGRPRRPKASTPDGSGTAN
jgi:hypothetical protein